MDVSALLRPLNDRVVVLPDEPEGQTPGGILLPEQARPAPCRGTVLAVGPGPCLPDGTRRPLAVKPADRVLYSRYQGADFDVAGEMLKVLREEDLYLILLPST